ncbi:MAG: hypothetical protein OEN55_16005 [Alphaproteobacteria bacterium]|nr:hypothetical protein [Alphaproteobacteria bacterium]
MHRSVVIHPAPRPLAGVLIGALAALALLLLAGPAQAAPQGLGLVATAQPVPMLCDDDGCVAQLSSFCLQRERRSPNYGTRYRVAAGAGLRLYLTDARGGRRTVPADGLALLVSTRGNTGIEARVTAADRAALGAVEIAVAVGDLVTLLPEAEPGDADPITAAEAEFAAGPARLLAADIFDSPAALGESINILDRTINAVTRQARLSDEARRELWSRVAGAPLAAAEGSTAPAAQVFAACLDDLNRRMVYGLRNCLEGRRDELLIHANTQLWNALETGS